MTISILNIPNSAELGVPFSPVISFTGATPSGTVQIQDLTTSSSITSSYIGTSGTVPMTMTGPTGPHALRLTFSSDGVENFSVIGYHSLLSSAVTVSPAIFYVSESGSITPVTPSGGDGSLVYSIYPALPSGLNLSPSTGQITGTPSASYSASHTITIIDSSSQSTSRSFTLTVTYHAPVTSNTSTTVAYGSIANTINLAVQNPYTSVSVISSPTHGSASAVGTAITYTPTTGWNGTDSFTYRATGPGGTSNISTVAITISGANVTIYPTVTAGALNRGITSVPINPVSFNATGGKSPYQVTLTGGQLPSGLELTANTISGSPTAIGTENFILTTTDSSLPTHFTTATSYSINILSLNDVVTLVNAVPSSKYSQTSEHWNKSPLNVTSRNNWDQWGLYRSYIGSNVIGWGSDSIQNTPGTVDIPYSGANVDVIIIALGSADPNHPEFAVNSDGTGGSRVKYYDWLSGSGKKYIDKGYHSYDANAATAVTSIVAGNTYGWARNANIYTLDLTLMPGFVDLIFGGGAFTINLPDLSQEMILAFDAVSKFHSTKLPNSVTGLQNPTIVICNQTLTRSAFTATDVLSVQSGGTPHTGPFSTATLATYYIDTPFKDLSRSTTYRNDIKIYQNNTDVTAAVKRCTDLTGLVFVGPAGDYKGYVDVSTGPNYNNTVTVTALGTIPYAQGASPSNAGICVGAADAGAIEQIADYSAIGPGIKLYAPGSNLMVAFNSKQGVNNLYEPAGIPITDPRNDRYYIGKASGTSYAAAQVAGFLACLAQVQPTITQSSALAYLQSTAGINQLSTVTNSITFGSSVALYNSYNPAYSNFLNTYGVWPTTDLTSPGNSTPVEVDLFFTSPTTSTYTIIVSADNELQVYLNGSPTAAITTINSYYNPGSQSIIVSLNKGVNTLKCIALNYRQPGAGNPASFGVVVQDLYGNNIFETSANIPVAIQTVAPPSVDNLYLFGKFPDVAETISSSLPAVATNQPFSINVDNGVPGSAFYFKGKDIPLSTYNLNTGFVGNFTVTNQVFTTPGIKTYEFYFANTTDRITLSVEVIDHDATKIISSYTQTSKLWNKTHADIPPNANWLNWGLLRSSTTTNALNWGSNSTTFNTDGTISVPYAGLNVDIVIIDTGSVNPNHPEFALYSDGTGGTRVKYYDWSGSYPTSDNYNTNDANRVAAISGIAAGNTYGWARAAHIYSLNYTLLSGGNPDATAFNLVKDFHNAKPIDMITGYKKPTIIIAGWANQSITSIGGDVTYRGVTHAAPTQDELTQFGVLAPYTSRGLADIYLNQRDSILDAAVTSALTCTIVVSIPGDISAYCAKDNGDSNWDNHYVSGINTYYYHRGASPGAVPGVICVGALDSEVGQHKAPYSGTGPRVDLFAPGSDQITALSNVLGILNPVLNAYTPTVADSRNRNYYVGKDSGTAYAAANVAGYLAGLLQVQPSLTPTEALTTITQYASADQLSISIQGYGVNSDLDGANNLILYSVFPNYNENIITTIHDSTVTSVSLGEYFDIVITNGSPNTYFTYTGSAAGRGQLDANGNATINTFSLVNAGEYVYRFYFPLTNHTIVLKFTVRLATNVTSANIIHADDFDRIQNRVNYLVHDIYGKAPGSTTQITSSTITATSWSTLYQDIAAASIHQNNYAPVWLNPSIGERVTAQEVNSLTAIVDSLITNFDKSDPTQIVSANTLTITTSTNGVYDVYSRTYHWTTSTDFPITARNFFNLGGYMEVSFQNPILGNQSGFFTLTDYISGSGSISLPIPGGTAISKMYVQGINGNTATIDTIIAPNLDNTAIATGTVKVYVSTSATGGIAGQVPTAVDAALSQGQLSINPVSQFITLTGNNETTHLFTVKNTSPNDITVLEVNIIDDIGIEPLYTRINTGVPFVVLAHTSTNLSVSFQNVIPGGIANLYNNTIQLVSDGVNPLLNVNVPIVTRFGITSDPNPFTEAVFGPTTSTFNIVSYAGTYTSYIGTLTNLSSGFAVINPGITVGTGQQLTPAQLAGNVDPSQLTMGLLLYNYLFLGKRAPSTTQALRSPFPTPLLVVDVASVPNLNTSTQITLTATEKNNPSNVTTSVVDVEVLVDVQDYNIGSWLSPQNAFNGVIGFSYDMINGQRCLTVGFGMGSGSSPQVWGTGFPNFSLYAMSHLGRKFQTSINQSTSSAIIVSSGLVVWNKTIIKPYADGNIKGSFDTYIHSTLPGTTATTNAFLQTYGVWDLRDSRSTSLSITTATFLARDPGIYTYNISVGSIASTSTNIQTAFTITNGVMVGDPYIYGTSTATISIDNGTPIVLTVKPDSNVFVASGDIALAPGLHKIKVDATQTGNFGAVGVTIMNESGYVVWSTLDVMIPNWSEIGRIYLPDDGKPHTYQMVPNIWSKNVATGTTYSSFFANDSLVTVKDNGYGQLAISQNALIDLSGWIITDGTLLNYPYLFYYYSNAENQIPNNARYDNLQNSGQYTRYFTGFDPSGKVTSKTVLAPGYIAPPPVIIATYNYQVAGSGKSIPFWEIIAIGVLGVILVNYILGLFGTSVAGLLAEAAVYFAATTVAVTTVEVLGAGLLFLPKAGVACLVYADGAVCAAAPTAYGLIANGVENFGLLEAAVAADVAAAGTSAAVIEGAAVVLETAEVIAVAAEGAGFVSTLLAGAAYVAELTFGMCFTNNTKIEMSNGTTKFIDELKIGDKVFNHDKTSINTVTFIVNTTYKGALHSPDISVAPFGSLHHPLVINGTLSSYVPNHINANAPWLGECAPLNSAVTIDVDKVTVYNLLVDGDGTYTVNGFGTTSVFGDGGALIQCVAQGLITEQEALGILRYFHDAGGIKLRSWYLLNNTVSKLNSKSVNYLYVKALRQAMG